MAQQVVTELTRKEVPAIHLGVTHDDIKEMFDTRNANALRTSRVLELPADANSEGAGAELKDGILKLEIPKAARQRRFQYLLRLSEPNKLTRNLPSSM